MNSPEWNDKISKNVTYWVRRNLSYNQNEIKDLYEEPQNYSWMEQGHRIGSRLIRKFWGFYEKDSDEVLLSLASIFRP